ncbi:hypothetical protein Undi14_13110 [Undibacterium sp. 14-3-2]|jgi:hypothetical protein|uniref:hypothetical protein n=1 Tax=Undibacterium sp. 14-3-2 TaxID=2800129 RepID=UPI00190552B4|nr:hypothetical protein [Undibacterium sp. 14-3-2]MBK1890974.1 hypothetical protein [Undibacterium sp. 14-3-2]
MNTLSLRIAGLVFAGSFIFSPMTAQAEIAKNKAKVSSKASKTPTHSAKDEEEAEPDVQLHASADYKCELGNSLTMYSNADDPQHIAMRWKKRLYRMSRVETTTGAHRFENTKAGFIWIGIPAKGLLLDSRKGLQLANECKTNEQVLAESSAIADTAVQTK